MKNMKLEIDAELAGEYAAKYRLVFCAKSARTSTKKIIRDLIEDQLRREVEFLDREYCR